MTEDRLGENRAASEYSSIRDRYAWFYLNDTWPIELQLRSFEARTRAASPERLSQPLVDLRMRFDDWRDEPLFCVEVLAIDIKRVCWRGPCDQLYTCPKLGIQGQSHDHPAAAAFTTEAGLLNTQGQPHEHYGAAGFTAEPGLLVLAKEIFRRTYELTPLDGTLPVEWPSLKRLGLQE